MINRRAIKMAIAKEGLRTGADALETIERRSKRLAGRCGYPKDNPFAVTLNRRRK